MADACVFIMERVDFDDIVRMNRAGGEVRNVHLNIGTGREVSIRGLAELMGATVGFGGRLRFNADKAGRDDAQADGSGADAGAGVAAPRGAGGGRAAAVWLVCGTLSARRPVGRSPASENLERAFLSLNNIIIAISIYVDSSFIWRKSGGCVMSIGSAQKPVRLRSFDLVVRYLSDRELRSSGRQAATRPCYGRVYHVCVRNGAFHRVV